MKSLAMTVTLSQNSRDLSRLQAKVHQLLEECKPAFVVYYLFFNCL